MKIGFYQHSSVTLAEVAAAVAALGVKVSYRNALYFNERETEKFDRVIVDEGKNTEAIVAAYTAAKVPLVPYAEVAKGSREVEVFLTGVKPKKAEATPVPVPTPVPPEAPQPESSAAPEATPAPEQPKPTRQPRVPTKPLNVDAPRSKPKPGKKQGETETPKKGE